MPIRKLRPDFSLTVLAATPRQLAVVFRPEGNVLLVPPGRTLGAGQRDAILRDARVNRQQFLEGLQAFGEAVRSFAGRARERVAA